MYLLGNFFKKYHTHQRRTVHPLSPLSRTILHIFHPTTDMERCHRRIAVLYSQRVRAAAHRMGIVSTLSRKNISEENIPVGLCFPIVLRDYFRSFHLAISRWVLGGQSVLTQSSLVSFYFIVLFVLIAIAGSFFCRNYNDVRFFSVLLLFGIVTIHFIEAICQYSFTQALFQSKADISYYIFCIPYLLQILADTDYKRLMNPQTWIREKGYCG